MTNLEKIDFACGETYRSKCRKGHSDPMNYMKKALYQKIEMGNDNAFTRDNQARYAIMEVSSIEMKAELLKNVVKAVSYKEHTNDPEWTDRCLFDLSGDLSGVDTRYVENGLVDMIRNYNLGDSSMESGQAGFDCLENPTLLPHLIQSFVHTRYERGLVDEMEKETAQCQDILNHIDVYALRLQNGLSERSR